MRETRSHGDIALTWPTRLGKGLRLRWIRRPVFPTEPEHPLRRASFYSHIDLLVCCTRRNLVQYAP